MSNEVAQQGNDIHARTATPAPPLLALAPGAGLRKDGRPLSEEGKRRAGSRAAREAEAAAAEVIRAAEQAPTLQHAALAFASALSALAEKAPSVRARGALLVAVTECARVAFPNAPEPSLPPPPPQPPPTRATEEAARRIVRVALRNYREIRAEVRAAEAAP